MAGDWLKIRIDLPDDPGVIAMANALGVSRDEVVGKLLRFWGWADRQTADGYAPSVTKAFLDEHVRCDGFSNALCDVGWLTVDDEGINIPNFDRHNGKTAKKRAQAQKRMEALRSRDVNSVTSASPEKRREEKRREEIQQPPPTPSSGGGAAAADGDVVGLDKIADLLLNRWNQIPGVTVAPVMASSWADMLLERMTVERYDWWELAQKALDKLPSLPAGVFGKGKNNWCPKLKWFLQPDTVPQIVQGDYDNWQAYDPAKGKDDGLFLDMEVS